ncbi:autotransporter domain-containing protein [Jannaschia sp. LMIT008]|uniref:autotransporter domain-containing protein n=1 Tax=Jannaschia maritima TaxID=3032585 RepID=UPI002810A244|nr:autotransporter domain-containing protein [Jannaschia sp. LMIT008]
MPYRLAAAIVVLSAPAWSGNIEPVASDPDPAVVMGAVSGAASGSPIGGGGSVAGNHVGAVVGMVGGVSASGNVVPPVIAPPPIVVPPQVGPSLAQILARIELQLNTEMVARVGAALAFRPVAPPAVPNGGGVQASTRGRGEAPLRFRFDVDGLLFDDDPFETRVGIVRTELSFDATPDLELDLILGYADLDVSPDGQSRSSLDGGLTFVQPGVTLRRGSLRIDTGLFYGRGDADLLPNAPQRASADVDLWAVSLNAAYDLVRPNGLVATPMASLTVGRFGMEGRSGLLAGVPRQSVPFWTAEVGLRVTGRIGRGTGYLGSHFTYVDEKPTILPSGGIDGLSGRLEAGFDIPFGDRAALSGTIDVGGFGQAARSYRAGLALSHDF